MKNAIERLNKSDIQTAEQFTKYATSRITELGHTVLQCWVEDKGEGILQGYADSVAGAGVGTFGHPQVSITWTNAY